MFPVLCLRPCDYFVTTNLCFLISSPFHPTPLPSDNHQFSLCVFEFVSVLFVCLFCSLDSTCKWNHMVLVFLWLISLSIIPSRSIHAVTDGKISFFFLAPGIFSKPHSSLALWQAGSELFRSLLGGCVRNWLRTFSGTCDHLRLTLTWRRCQPPHMATLAVVRFPLCQCGSMFRKGDGIAYHSMDLILGI